MNILSITWDVNPEIFSIGLLSVRWYGLLWACAVLACWLIVNKIFRHEKHPENWGEKIFYYGLVGLVVGARLGHCFFYEWHPLVEPVRFLGITFTHGNPYLANPIDLIKIWQGGLSSHGGAIGLLVGMYLYNKNVIKKGFIWMLDRLVIGVAIGGAFIRFGNLMNSEIYGGPTSLPWGFIFVRAGETEPMHPTQIYEMLYCLITFAIVWWMYWKKQSYRKPGLIFGVFLLGIFGTRFLLEFLKWNQVAFEYGMLLNMGQWLSVPFIIWGIYLLIRARKMTPLPDEAKRASTLFSDQPRKSRKEIREEKKQKK